MMVQHEQVFMGWEYYYLVWTFFTLPSRSTWPAEYCSITSLTSYGFKASLNLRRATKYFICQNSPKQSKTFRQYKLQTKPHQRNWINNLSCLYVSFKCAFQNFTYKTNTYYKLNLRKLFSSVS